MNILTMKKEDFEKVPFRNAETNLDDFYSAVIIPTEDMHDSGYRCMDFVAVNSKKEPICRLSGCSDVLDIDGIGGYGLNGVLSDMVDNKAWKIDCLPCGYLRIFAGTSYKLQADSIPVSDYSLYAVKTVRNVVVRIELMKEKGVV